MAVAVIAALDNIGVTLKPMAVAQLGAFIYMLENETSICVDPADATIAVYIARDFLCALSGIDAKAAIQNTAIAEAAMSGVNVEFLAKV